MRGQLSRQTPLAPTGPRVQSAGQVLVEPAAVGQARQRIGVRLHAQLFLDPTSCLFAAT
jgi:hypothetical protein